MSKELSEEDSHQLVRILALENIKKLTQELEECKEKLRETQEELNDHIKIMKINHVKTELNKCVECDKYKLNVTQLSKGTICDKCFEKFCPCCEKENNCTCKCTICYKRVCYSCVRRCKHCCDKFCKTCESRGWHYHNWN